MGEEGELGELGEEKRRREEKQLQSAYPSNFMCLN